MPDPDYHLEQTSTERGNEQIISVSVAPPLPFGCNIARIWVNDVGLKTNGQTIGNITVVNLSIGAGYFALKAPKNQPPVKLEVSVVCPKSQFLLSTFGGLSVKNDANPVEATKGFLDGIVDVFKKIADFLGGGFKDLLPKDLREGLKKIKGLVGKGVDVVSNLLPLFKGIPIPLGGLPLTLPDNLDHLKKKIGEHLKDLDPLDDSPEAVLADAEALRALILDDVIPYVKQVGAFALGDLQQYAQRVSVMRKMSARLGDQLDMISRATKRKRPTKSKRPVKRKAGRKLK